MSDLQHPLHATQGGETGPADRSKNDTPAARGVLVTVVILLIVCSVIAALIYNAWNPKTSAPANTEQTTP